MNKMIIDILKRVGSDFGRNGESAYIVSISYTEGTSLYSIHRIEIDYEIAEKINEGNKYLDYDHNIRSCTIYNIKEKIIDKFHNIILLADDLERIPLEERDY